MEAKPATLGRSLKVPIVQELAKEKPATVPSRYVRGDDGADILSPSHLQIPIIDMHNLFHPDPDFADSELHKLHNASKQWGFFQLINHGVESEIIEKMKSEIQEFFNLPADEKERFRQVEADVEGYGQAFVVSEEQTLDWGDMLFFITLPPHLRKPNLIPQLPPASRASIEAYAAQLKNLAMKILKLMGKALGIEMEALFDEGMQSMRMNYYPPCPQPELVLGLCPHSDGVALTILLQVNQMVEGLQIKKDGLWIPVSPLPDAFVINIGDILEIITNGAYRSIEHRATVNIHKERLSIATFLSPNLEAQIGPSPSLVGPETPPKFKTIAAPEFFRGLFSQELIGKSYVETLRI